MKPTYHDEWLTIYGGDVRDVLPELAADSVDCIVTSPPYWGLRDYGQDGQFGLERTPEEYVANMVGVFRELRRVLKPSGTCWLNLGDSYATGGGSVGRAPGGGDQGERFIRAGMIGTQPNRMPLPGLKPKDLVGIPWRVAFALQADGWYLRSDIIWSKPNPMPESVTDRPTKSHEYLFLLTKSARYYFDADAVREPHARLWDESNGGNMKPGSSRQVGEKDFHRMHHGDYPLPNPAGRNIRSVWTIATRPYPGAHFAVFPPELPERCIKAGSSERGVCPECSAPWERVVKTTDPEGYRPEDWDGVEQKKRYGEVSFGKSQNSRDPSHFFAATIGKKRETTGWRPSCAHTADPIPATVLDPFAGSGTTGMVANRLSRRAILIDLNPEYLKQQLTRNAQTPLGLTEGDAA